MTKYPDDHYEINENGCHVWKGYKAANGYVHLYRDGKMTYMHRYIYEKHVGAIPEGLVIDHLCRNRACVNPEHLEAVMNAANLSRGTAMVTHCPHGHPYSSENTRWVGRSRKCKQCEQSHRAKSTSKDIRNSRRRERYAEDSAHRAAVLEYNRSAQHARKRIGVID